MEFPAEWAKFLDKSFFDEVVDVFGASSGFLEPRGIGFRTLENSVERTERLPHFRRGENADRFERFGPGAVHGNFVGQETTVDRKGALERFELSVGLTLEAPSP